MHRRRVKEGLAAMCIGAGGGISVVIENHTGF